MMTAPTRLIIRNNDQFLENFSSLNNSSIVCCRLRLCPGEEHIFIDLQMRGVTLIPSATSQVASRSKVHQARIFSEFMLPHTLVVYDRNQLLAATSTYRQLGIEEVVVKQDRKNGGLGIHHFRDIEEVYNLTSFGSLPFPLVLQPFVKTFRDVRVIILGDYIEAYERINPYNFRHNLHCGGEAVQLQADDTTHSFCKAVMQRGDFPYGHIDLMVTEEKMYLTEINLRGGLRGAAIDSISYREKVEQVHDQLLESSFKK